MPRRPLAYLITFHTYGTWLPGESAGSVDRRHNAPGGAMVPADEQRREAAKSRQVQDAVCLDACDRWIVHHTIETVCDHRQWRLHAAHVRTNHVHIVVTVDTSVERAMNTIKSWSTRRLVEHGRVRRGRRMWARHGSTRWLWSERQVAAAVRYTIDRQGAPLPMTPPADAGEGSDL